MSGYGFENIGTSHLIGDVTIDGDLEVLNSQISFKTNLTGNTLQVEQNIAGNAHNIVLSNKQGGISNSSGIDFDFKSGTACRINVEDDNFSSGDFSIHTKEPGDASNLLVERLRIQSDGFVGLGNGSPICLFDVRRSNHIRNLSDNGSLTRFGPVTIFNDVLPNNSTVALGSTNAFLEPLYTASNTNITYTDAATLYIQPPVSGSNVTITNAYGLYSTGDIKTTGTVKTLSLNVDSTGNITTVNSTNIINSNVISTKDLTGTGIVSAPTGNLTTVNSTTANITTVNSTNINNSDVISTKDLTGTGIVAAPTVNSTNINNSDVISTKDLTGTGIVAAPTGNLTTVNSTTANITSTLKLGNVTITPNTGTYSLVLPNTQSLASNVSFLVNDGTGALSWKPNAFKYIKAYDQKTVGTNGGTSTAGSWVTRTLNTLQTDITGVTLSANMLTLPAGRYYVILGSCPSDRSGLTAARIIDSNNNVLLSGSNNRSVTANTTNVSVNATVTGPLNFSTTTSIYLQQRVSTSQNNTGYGAATGFGPEIYSTLDILQLL